MERKPFRIEVEYEDGNRAHLDVIELAIYVWDDLPLEISTEHGLVVRGPKDAIDAGLAGGGAK